MERIWIGLGALAGLTGVGMAALAAHGLGWMAPGALQMLRSAVDMQGWHALALLFTGLWVGRGGRLAQTAGVAFALGITLFCGTVYSLALGGPIPLALAPVGGTLLMLGWALLGLSALRRSR